MTDSQNRIDIKFFLLFIPVAYFSYLFHELGHWSVGEVLGNRMAYSLNYVWPKAGHYVQESHAVYVSIGGPAFSVLEALFALLVIERFKAMSAYSFAFVPMFNRFFSLLLGGFSKQDEARVAVLLDTGTYVVAIIVLGVLLSIVIRCSYKLGIGLKTNAYILTIATVSQLLVIGTYTFFKL